MNETVVIDKIRIDGVVFDSLKLTKMMFSDYCTKHHINLIFALLSLYNDNDKAEGVLYKNVIGTYLHGPLFPKNPHLCDYIIKKALQNKYGEVELEELDDSVEFAANDYIVNRFRS